MHRKFIETSNYACEIDENIYNTNKLKAECVISADFDSFSGNVSK
jgi:hypothetical protein